jgi:hypothetical protein
MLFKMLRPGPPPFHPMSRIAGLAEATVKVRTKGRAQKVVIGIDIRIIVFFSTMSSELFFCVESYIAIIFAVDGRTCLAVPDVKGAVVLVCFVVPPICVVIEGSAARFVDCAEVSSHGCRLVLR